jgi:hypothetical protein
MYSETLSEILVFKTNITNEEERSRLADLLSLYAHVIKWNIDIQDIDHVLRVEADGLRSSTIIELLHSAGFECEELPD